MRMGAISIGLVAMLAAAESASGFNKCTGPDGRITYQDEPCRKASADSIDDPLERARDAERRRQRSSDWEELMKKRQAEINAKPLPKSAFMPSATRSLSDAEFDDQLANYAVIIGRSSACGADATALASNVGRAIDTRYGVGTTEQKQRLLSFTEGAALSARAQRDGQTPDSCSEVRRVFPTVPPP